MVIVILIVLGLCLGSFINALVYRVHAQSELAEKKPSKATKKQLEALSISKGRSMCPHCKHELAPKDLIPVVSWLSLKGKCRYCGKPIPDTPLPELLTPVLFIVSYIAWPYSFTGNSAVLSQGWVLFGFWLMFVVGFIALAIYDLRWYLLPNRLVFPLLGLAVIQVAVRLIFYHGGWPVLWGALWGIAIDSGIFYVLFQLSAGRWIGGGDVKLGLVIGLLAGTLGNALLLIFAASLLGTLVALPGLLTGKMQRTSKLPFGPFLLAATFLVVLWGSGIIHWYTSQLAGL